MTQADTVVRLPLDAGTTDFLRDAIGSPIQKLDSVTTRLAGIEALLHVLKQDERLPTPFYSALSGIEQAVNDCIGVIESRPIGGGQ